MTRLVGWMGVSIDGRIAGPGGDLSWHHVDQPMLAEINAQLGQMSAFAFGRRMWENMSEFWPTAEEDPGSPSIGEFLTIWRRMPKIVISRTMEGDPGHGARLLRGDLADTVATLRDECDGDVVAGGAEIIRALLELDELDVLHVLVNPLVLGEGPRLFEGDGPRRSFELVASRVFDNGVVKLHYERLPGSAAG